MRLIPYYISAMLMVLFYASCNSHQSSKGTEKDIIAEFDGEAIYASEINTIIKQELYDELCRIHNIKKEALEQLINVKLLQKEANKKQLTYQQYIDEYTDAKIKKTGTDSLLKRYKFNHGISWEECIQCTNRLSYWESDTIVSFKGSYCQ